MKIETHAHTKEGSPDSLVSVIDKINLLINKKYDGMIITDHNSYEGYNKAKSLNIDGFTIIKGIEYDTSDAGHMIIILPSKVDSNIFTHRGLGIKETIHFVKALGGIIGPAHPFDYYKLGILNNGQWIRNQKIIENFDFVESFNSCGSILGNSKSKLLAKAFNKPTFGGSDSHRLSSTGKAYTVLPEEIRNEDELIKLTKQMKYEDTKSEGEYFEGTSRNKLGILYEAGIRTYCGANKLMGKLSKRKAIREAIALSIV